MSQLPAIKEFKIETPATYRIRVQGHIDSAWSEMICDMNITNDSTSGNSKVTSMVGHLADQAALSGVLKALYDLRIAILSVENLDEKSYKKAKRQLSLG